VGRLKNIGMFERLDNKLKWVIDTDVTPCYWGDDWVILHNLQDSKATQIIHEERTNGSTPLLDLQKWSQDISPTHRLAWVLLWGLPPTVWEPESMGKVVADIGDLVEVDEMVEQRRRIDVARILIRTQRRSGIQSAVMAAIDGAPHVLHVVEDMTCLGAWPNPKRMTSGLPPSLFSTEPNSSGSAGADTHRDDSPFDISDGSPGNVDGFSSDGSQPCSLQTRRGHWVKAIGRRCLDRAFSDHGDGDLPPNDNNFLNPPTIDSAVSNEVSSGQKLIKRSAINDLPNKEGSANNQKQEAQHGNLFLDIPVGAVRYAGGVQHKPILNQESLPAPFDQPHNRNHTPPGKPIICVDEGEIWASDLKAQSQLLLLGTMLGEKSYWGIEDRPYLMKNQLWTSWLLKRFQIENPKIIILGNPALIPWKTNMP